MRNEPVASGIALETSVPAAIARYEQRMEQLEKEKLLMEESLQKSEIPQGRFDEMFELAMLFLANLTGSLF